MTSLFSEEALSALTFDVVEKGMENDDAASTASGISSNPASLPSSPGVSEHAPPSSTSSPTKSPASPWTPTVAPESLKDLPSLGSLGHFAGLCSRCCFHAKGRCQNGYDCRFCHFDHEKRQRKKKIVINARGLPAAPMHQQLENGGFHNQAWSSSVTQIPQHVSGPPTSQSMAGLQPVPAPPGLELPAPPPPPLHYPVVNLPATPTDHDFSPTALPPIAAPTSPAPVVLGPIAQPPAEPPQMQAVLEASIISSVADWPVEKVMDWLSAAGLGHIAENFEEHRITGDVLLELTSGDLEEIGVRALGDKKRLLRAVAQLRSAVPQASCPPPPPSWQAVC